MLNLLNKVFGRLTVIEKDFSDKHGVHWKCKCNCGNVITVRGSRLISGTSQSCGCLAKEITAKRSKKDYTGLTINHVTFLSNTNTKDNQGNYIWNCKCVCGKEFLTAAYVVTRKISATRSCGCFTRNRMHVLGKEQWRKNHLGISKSATKFLDTLEQLLHSKIEREVPIENRLYDGKYKDTLIEVDGAYWHRTRKQKANDQHKNQLAKSAGLNLIRVAVRREADAQYKAKELFESGVLCLQ